MMQMEQLKPLTDSQIEEKIEYFAKALQPYAKDSKMFMSIMIAQVGLESYWGTSTLAKNANNFTGHKFKEPFSSKRPNDYYIKDAGESVDGSFVVDKNALWRKYKDVNDWAKHHADWITQSDWYAEHYSDAVNAKTPEEQAKALTKKYASDPSYNVKLIDIVNKYGLRKYDKKDDTKQESEKMAITKPKIIDRRTQALGYPGHGAYAKRSKSAIKYIVWHYTATIHQGYGADVIKAHENYWRSHHGWNIGGYHYYIDRAGNIFWNYDLEKVSYGAGTVNPVAMHISLEASHRDNYTEAQIKSREDLTAWLIKDVLTHLGANSIKRHSDFMSTSCPGYTASEMKSYTDRVAKKIDSDWGDSSNDPQEIETSKSGKYTVKHGDTLWAIAKAHDVTVAQLQEWNSIAEGQWLKTGQLLYVVEPKLNAYTVKKGDYLHKIATEYNITVDELKKWNNLQNNLIYTGQELFTSDPNEVIEVVDDNNKPDESVEPIGEDDSVVVEETEDQPVDEGEKTPAIELKENQYLNWEGKVFEVKEVI